MAIVNDDSFDDTRKTPNSAEYQRQHRWVKKQLGNATYCSVDKSHISTRYDWSNISKEYLSDLDDWQQLCRACHRAYDPMTDKGKQRLSELKKVQSLGNTSRRKSILKIYPNGSWVKFASAKLAAESLGIARTNVCHAALGERPTAGGYRWRYVS